MRLPNRMSVVPGGWFYAAALGDAHSSTSSAEMPRNVMVAVDHSPHTEFTLSWALTNIAKPEDVIVLCHAYVPEAVNFFGVFGNTLNFFACCDSNHCTL